MRKKGKKMKKSGSERRRGIYILPNIFTTLNIFCGFFAVIRSINGQFVAAAIAILVAAVFDTLDGKIARATRTSSRFGIEYDSLSDLISFGLAPGLMVYLWALRPLGRIGWLAAFLFMVCGALRLARFNTQTGSVGSEYFVGLPIPAAASMAAAAVLFCHRLKIDGSLYPVVLLVMLYGLSFLMVSTIRYFSFKNLEVFKSMHFNMLVAVVLVLIFIAAQPSIALFAFWFVYALSGPVDLLRRHHKPSPAVADAEDPDNPESLPL